LQKATSLGEGDDIFLPPLAAPTTQSLRQRQRNFEIHRNEEDFDIDSVIPPNVNQYEFEREANHEEIDSNCSLSRQFEKISSSQNSLKRRRIKRKRMSSSSDEN
jgi:hypothetical protein